MQDELEKFVHDENIKKFTVMLTVEKNDDRRKLLTKLLTEEMAGSCPQRGAKLGFPLSPIKSIEWPCSTVSA